MENIVQMEYVRDNYKEKFDSLKNQLLKDCDTEKRKIIKDYLNNFSVSKINELPKNYQIILNQTLLDLNYEFDKIIRNYSVEDFASDYIFREKSEKADYLEYIDKKQKLQDEYKENLDFDIETETNNLKSWFFGKYKNKYLLQKSMQLVVNFERGGDNPNHIYNAYNFYYAHFNVDDNLYMTEMQRNNYKNSRAVGTASHDQDIIGLRRSSEGAIYDSFSSANIFTSDIQKFDWTGKVRAIVIDPGFNHPTGMTDWAVDLNYGEAWCLQERKIDFKVEYIGEKSLDTIYMEFLKLVRGAKERATPEYVIIDPSKPELIEFIGNFGFSVYAANNQNWTTDRKDKEISEQITARELRGIPLVQTAFARLKIHIHENCPLLIKEIGSYAYVQNDKDSTDKLPKLYDDLVVTVKYLVNTLGIRPSMWENDSEESENDQRKLLGDEETKDSQWNVETALSNIFGQDQTESGIFDGQEDGDNDFFSGGSSDFFS